LALSSAIALVCTVAAIAAIGLAAALILTR